MEHVACGSGSPPPPPHPRLSFVCKWSLCLPPRGVLSAPWSVRMWVSSNLCISFLHTLFRHPREEREKHHKALGLEVKKLKAEVKDICKHFDDTVAALFQKYLKVYTYVKAQVCVCVCVRV